VPNADYVIINMYDASGRKIAVLDAGFRAAGHYRIAVDASEIAGGLYFIQLRAGRKVLTKKIEVVK
jgi:hypothetical protein